MRVKAIVSAALTVIAISVAIPAAQAAPAGSAMGALKTDTAHSGVVEKTTYGYWWHRRHGWRHYGYRYSHGWRPHYRKRHDHNGWTPYYGYGWKPHYGRYSYHFRGYDSP